MGNAGLDTSHIAINTYIYKYTVHTYIHIRTHIQKCGAHTHIGMVHFSH